MNPLSLAELSALPRWVGWRIEMRSGRPTKVPYDPATGRCAASDSAATWGSKQAAQQWAFRHVNGSGGGIGVMLGDLGDGRALGGLDFDTCRDEQGIFLPWALEGLRRSGSYAEISPSRSGAKAFFIYDPAELPRLREVTGSKWGKMWKQPGAGDHPPAIELHLGNRYFAVTAEQLDTGPAELRPMPDDTLRWIIEEAGPALTGQLPKRAAAKAKASGGDTAALKARVQEACLCNAVLSARWAGDWTGLQDRSRSGLAFALGAALKAAGFSFADTCAALELHPDTRQWTLEKGQAGTGRELRRIFDNASASPPEPWGTPDMSVIGTGRRAPPALPLNLFGDAWARWLVTTAEAAACPVDYVAMSLVTTASALIGNARWPQAGEGWTEPPHLWVCIVGDSGGGKSPGTDAIFRDVLPEVESRMMGDYPDRLQMWRAENEAAKAREERWKRDVENATKSGHPPPMPPKALETSEPQAPRLRQNDVTIERVATLLATAAPKGLLMWRDELAGWLQGMESYSDAARPFWLEAYGGRPYRVERQKHPQPIIVARNAVAVFGGTQPEKVAELFESSDDGLLARLLWSWPDAIRFRLGRTRPAVAVAIEALDRLRCLELQPGEPPAPIMVPLRPELLDVIEAFGADMQERQQGAAGLMRSAYGKARGTVLRLSLVLEMLRWCIEPGGRLPPVQIGELALAAACDLVAGYFLPMAERVYGDAATPPGDRAATVLAKWIIKTKPSVVHVRTLQRTIRLPGLKDAAAIHAAAAALVEADWLRCPEKGSFQARAPAAYPVNPALLAAP